MKNYYWKCELCDLKGEAKDLQEAKIQLELHESNDHQGKQVGIFGWEKIEDSQT